MGFVLLFDQDASFTLSAKSEPGQAGTYEEETKALGYSMAEYYKHSLKYYNNPALYRWLLWSAYSFWTGWVCFWIPFFAYG